MKFHKSRLQKLEEKRSLKQAVFFFILSIFIILALIFLGLPLIIKISILLTRNPSLNENEKNPILKPVTPQLSPILSATNSAFFSFDGFAPAGLKVKLFVNEEPKEETIVDKEGHFSFTKVKLIEGKNEIKVISLLNEEESEPAFAQIIYKKNPPLLTITHPENKAIFYEEEKEIDITGITDPQTTILVNNRLAMVDEKGNFFLKFSLEEGENEIKVLAKDEAGNQNEKTLTVTYQPK